MTGAPNTSTREETRAEVRRWIEEHAKDAPEAVRATLRDCLRVLEALEGSVQKTTQLVNELRRAMGITPRSERQSSGYKEPKPDGVGTPRRKRSRDPKERLLIAIQRSKDRLAWHRDKLRKRHREMRKLRRRLAALETEDEDLDEEASEKEKAEVQRETAAAMQRLLSGDGPDPTLASSAEALISGGAVTTDEEVVAIPVSADKLEGATVLDTRVEERVRHDFSLAVNRIVLEVEKKVIVGPDGERSVVSGSTLDVGPPRFSVTWGFLVNMTLLVVLCAVPMNRLARMLSSEEKTFSASALSKMLRYVAHHFAPIYLQLFDELSDAEILMGDDTSPRVLEVQRHFRKGHPEEESPWHPWPERNSKKDSETSETLGAALARELGFQFARRSGDGKKRALHTTVLAGRGHPEDPSSFIVFYRSHLGSLGNLLEVLLGRRNPDARKLTVQSDLSTANFVTAPEHLRRFEILQAGCLAHARRPFVRYHHEGPDICGIMLGSFSGLSALETSLDEVGRNRENVAAIRDVDGRELWTEVEEAAALTAKHWSPATKLGEAARYILRHREELTAYLDDPRLSADNNLSERMLRMEKLIESSSMFRVTLEGRFTLDILRTIGQTATSAGVSVADYLMHVLKTPYEELARTPQRFTPHAWAQSHSSATDTPGDGS